MKKSEAKIEKTLRKVDDLYQFYKKIPKIETAKKSTNKGKEKRSS